MAGRRTNLALLLAFSAAFISGWAAFGVGTGWNAWVSIGHGVAGLVIIVLIPWKAIVVRRGLARRRAGKGPSVALILLSAFALVSGVLHATGLVTRVGPVSGMQLHVGTAIAALPLLLWHVRKRPARVHRADLSRRSMLRAGAVLASSAGVYLVSEAIVRATSLPGARRRFTGSYERGTNTPENMPVTQWLTDSVPRLDSESWRVAVAGAWFGRDELDDYGDTIRAVLDCTGGWFAAQEWTGVWVRRLLPEGAAGRSIVVRSVTGYERVFPAADAGRLLLATRAGGAPLSYGHGFPARLVAPGRRGFWWVKWVASIEPTDRPWWLQPPFPPS